ncbi:MAG: hypothetical protein KBE09_04640 [Candidatus Pacebacteria bacterium]|nr:hypothetical protein [Candidatus Paceibacterota bacterium]
MKKILITLVAIAVIGAVAYYFKPTGATPAALPTDASLAEALRTITINVSEFGGNQVTLVNGESPFPTGTGTSSVPGFVKMSDKRAIVFKGEDADIFTVMHINGGGSGTFQFLTWFTYTGATKTLAEKQRLALGDRIMINDVAVNQTAPTEFDVLVSIKERRATEPMTTEPSQPRVLHFAHSSLGLTLRDVIFGTVAAPEIVVASPLPGSTTPRSFTIAGAARGPWYFEANLPIEIRNATGTPILSVSATAQGEWMTTELVPFSTLIEIPNDVEAGLYTVVIRKDNPSGLPENDASVEFPILVQ